MLFFDAVVRANAVSAGDHCGEVLAKASRLLYETTTAERYTTVFYGVYDPEGRILVCDSVRPCELSRGWIAGLR